MLLQELKNEPNPWRSFHAAQEAVIERSAAQRDAMQAVLSGLGTGIGDRRLRDREQVLAHRIWGELRGRPAGAPSLVNLGQRVRPGFESEWLDRSLGRGESTEAARELPGGSGGGFTMTTRQRTDREASRAHIAAIMKDRTPGLEPGNLLLQQQNVKMQPYY